MSDQNTYTPHYSLADIEQYLQGKMTAAEMYALEKAALQDPFLADAIEGYNAASIPEAHQHLHEIQEWLLPGKKEAKVVPLATTSNKGWRIAAIAILLLGAGIITWLLLPGVNRKQEVATTTPPVIIPGKAAPAAPVTDSTSTTILQHNSVALSANSHGALSSNQLKTDTLSLLASNEREKQNSVLYKRMPAIRADTVTFYTADMYKKEPVAKEENSRMDLAGIEYKRQQQADSSQLAFTNLSADKDKAAFGAATSNVLSANHLQGRIINQQGEAIVGASVNINHSHNTVTDANGNFSFTSTDTAASILVNSIGYLPQQNIVSTNASNSIVLQENTNALNEVAVIGYSTTKKRYTPGALPADNKMAIVKMDTLMPEGGWDKFKLYVANTIMGDNNLDDIENIEFHGELEFEFRVDDKGNVKDVTILKSPDENKNGVIAEALKQGPRWAIPDKKKKRKNKAIIHF